MSEIKKLLDNTAEKILHLYKNTSWSRYNRTGLGVIGSIMMPFVGMV